MSERVPNAILLGGPDLTGGRQVYTGPDAAQFSARAADGYGHVWQSTYRIELCKGGLRLRAYTYAGCADQTAPPPGACLGASSSSGLLGASIEGLAGSPVPPVPVAGAAPNEATA